MLFRSVLFDCPVFAIWGEKDVQVLPGINRSKLETVVTHNTNLQADFLIIPNLNHLMQTAKTGLPDEYESIDEAISPVALEAMGLWLRKREILP